MAPYLHFEHSVICSEGKNKQNANPSVARIWSQWNFNRVPGSWFRRSLRGHFFYFEISSSWPYGSVLTNASGRVWLFFFTTLVSAHKSGQLLFGQLGLALHSKHEPQTTLTCGDEDLAWDWVSFNLPPGRQ